MTQLVSEKTTRTVGNVFEWRSMRHRMIPITSMATTHLYNTVVMIWNHAVPEPLKYRPFNHYVFGSFYTKEYMFQAIRYMLPELARRDNLKAYQRDRLNDMCSRARSFLVNKIEDNHESKDN